MKNPRSGFRYMMFFYGAMAGVPVLLWLLSVLSAIDTANIAKIFLGFLIAIGSIIFGVVGIKEVFVHGKRE
jgi:hypothetical protein